MITRERAKTLKRGDVICIPRPNRTPERWRVNGAIKTWKTMPGRFSVPLKHGLYAYDVLDDTSIDVLNNMGAYIEGEE